MIKCKDCGYQGITNTTKKFGRVTRYICPSCGSRELEYVLQYGEGVI